MIFELQDDRLEISQLGRLFRILAVADSVEDANRYLEAHDKTGVIRTIGPFVFIADCRDEGRKPS